MLKSTVGGEELVLKNSPKFNPRNPRYRNLAIRDDLLQVLTALSESKSPIGAWSLKHVLEERRAHVSEATCGRLLRVLEEGGCAVHDGRRGRVITPKGAATLREWQRQQVHERVQTAFMQSLGIQQPEDLVDVLVALRAIERETAALAAVNAAAVDIERMRTAICKHSAVLAADGLVTDPDSDFHVALACASRNAVLRGALEVIHCHPGVVRALESIRFEVGPRMVEEHSAILDRIEKRDPEGAREAMTEHLNNIIKQVDTYLKEPIISERHKRNGHSRAANESHQVMEANGWVQIRP